MRCLRSLLKCLPASQSEALDNLQQFREMGEIDSSEQDDLHIEYGPPLNACPVARNITIPSCKASPLRWLALGVADELVKLFSDECCDAFAVSPECGIESLFSLVIETVTTLKDRVFGDLWVIHTDDPE